MDWLKRMKVRKEAISFSPGRKCNIKGNIDTIEEGSVMMNTSQSHHPKQFIFTSQKKRVTLWSKIMHRINPDDFTYEPNSWIKKYINWAFRTDFFSVFISFLAVFMFLIFTFGVFLMLAGMGKGQCFIVGDGDFTITTSGLADGFALSWTTFTTVGYGAVYPATGNEYGKQFDCIWITIITTTESFIGLLYAGMCAAILFGKIGRIQSHAQVRFSDAICIEYGKKERQVYSNRSITDNSGNILSKVPQDDATRSKSATPNSTNPIYTVSTFGSDVHDFPNEITVSVH